MSGRGEQRSGFFHANGVRMFGMDQIRSGGAHCTTAPAPLARQTRAISASPRRNDRGLRPVKVAERSSYGRRIRSEWYENFLPASRGVLKLQCSASRRIDERAISCSLKPAVPKSPRSTYSGGPLTSTPSQKRAPGKPRASCGGTCVFKRRPQQRIATGSMKPF